MIGSQLTEPPRRRPLRNVHRVSDRSVHRHVLWQRNVPTFSGGIVMVRVSVLIESDWQKQVVIEVGDPPAPVITIRSPQEAAAVRYHLLHLRSGGSPALGTFIWDRSAGIFVMSALSDGGTVRMVRVPAEGAPKLCEQIVEAIDDFVYLRNACL